ncbi:MAG: hypothetical protein ACKVQS_10070 [Fimbriimonadaceae bacterium]
MKMVGLLGVILFTSIPSHEIRLDDPRLTISFKAEQSIFPTAWQTPEIKPAAIAINPSDESSSVQAIKHALAKYPNKLTETNLKTIYISQNLSFYGLNYGGTNYIDSLYLTLIPIKQDDINLKFLERAFHHELSSILLRNHSQLFPNSAWIAANPPDFNYRGDGTQSLREGTASTKYNDKLNEQGFLAEYSTSSVEEDFNMFAEAIFSGDPDFWRIYNRFPAVAKKADLVMNFYNKLDPTFSKTLFTQFAQAHTQ